MKMEMLLFFVLTKIFNVFNISAARMNMPEIPEEIFMEGMRQLIAIDKNWIPSKPEHSLYIRPLMYCNGYSFGCKTV
jgi:branched-chain amino acid aminotransferase